MSHCLNSMTYPFKLKGCTGCCGYNNAFSIELYQTVGRVNLALFTLVSA